MSEQLSTEFVEPSVSMWEKYILGTPMKPADEPPIHIWLDGSCIGNPGKGGWSCLIKFEDGTTKEFRGTAEHTTNNRMEIFPIGIALVYLRGKKTELHFHSDSLYAAHGIRRDWNFKSNLDLWKGIWSEIDKREYPVHAHWVKGHSGVEFNEMCDSIANTIASQLVTTTTKT